MGHKINILISESDYTSFHSVWMEKIWQEYFDLIIVRLDCDISYDKTRTLIATRGYGEVWYRRFLDQGLKIIIDNTWEMVGLAPKLDQNYHTHIMENRNWYWYNESLWYRHLGYHEYKPEKTYKKTALIPMNGGRQHRASLKTALHPWSDRIILSAGWCNQYLPGDMTDRSHGNWERYFNHDWYNQTFFSIVAETTVGIGAKSIFVTEKTYKPLAFYHPFMVLGQPGVLTHLKSQGFETYNNLFDESYDSIADIDVRIDQIVGQVSTLVPGPYDSETQKKIQYNHDHFFDKDLVVGKIIQEIINPILEFANA